MAEILEDLKFYKISKNDINLLTQKRSDELLPILSKNKYGLEPFLADIAKNVHKIDLKLIDNILQILKEACSNSLPSGMQGSLRRYLRLLMECESFLFVLVPSAIGKLFEKKREGVNLILFLTNYIIVLHKILKYYPCARIVDDVFPRVQNYINRLNESKSASAKSVSSDISKEFSQLKWAVDNYQKETNSSDDEANAETFRQLSIVPKYNDIVNYEVPDVPVNIIDRPYKSVSHYLNVHFRLIREDMLRTFREVVNACIERGCSTQNQDGFSLYESVSIGLPPKYTPDGILYDIKLTSSKKINWSSKRVLTPGSLLCLTPDSFRSVVFASVDSEPKMSSSNVKEASLKIKLEDDTYTDELSDRFYQIIEPSAYFEGYKHVLRSIKDFSEGNFPLADIITYLDFENSRPEYLKEFNFKFCLHECCDKETEDDSHPCKEFNPLFDDWPSAEELELDEQQFEAFRVALTNKVAVIQGPPGTGKTHIGVKIVKALLDNVPYKPIVICCMSNHALDQFLERILQHTEKVVRLGGQSQSVKLQPYVLRSYEMAIRKHRECNGEYEITDALIKKSISLIEKLCPVLLESKASSENRGEEFFEIKGLSKQLNEDYAILRLCKEKYLDETALNHIIPSKQKDQLCKGSASHGKLLASKMLEWLCQSRDKVLYEQCKKHFSKISVKQSSSFNNENQLWSLTLSERFRLLYIWRQQCLDVLERRIADDLEVYKTKMRMHRMHAGKDPVLMQCADIVGVTSTGASKYKDLIRQCNPRILIVEEAAEVLEAHIIAALVPSVEHMILIGDHKQLRPLPADNDLSENYNLKISMFERLFENRAPSATLVSQHRMKPCIAELLVPGIYDELQSYKNVYAYEDIRGFASSMYFLNHNEFEDTNSSGKSSSNKYECRLIISLAKYLLAQSYSNDKITILATYAAQVALIGKELEAQKLEIKVTTVDNYQGEENDVLLISFVRSNLSAMIGFLKESNRVCVALSRAKLGMFCVGNFKLFSSKNPLWKEILEKLEANNMTGDTIPLQCNRHKVPKHVRSPEEILSFLQDGCSEKCGYVLPCGHECEESCHFYDPEHLKYYCKKPCEKYIDETRICPRLCCQPCKKSKKYVFELPCGHVSSGRDGNVSVENIKCMVEVQTRLPCDHIATLPCYVDASKHQCEKLVRITLSCGHTKQVSCSKKDNSHQVCFESEQKSSPCGHIVYVPCSMNLQDYEIVAFCDKICDTLLECGHECLSYCRVCFDTGIHGLCSLQCENKLPCGHDCSRPCGSPCGSCEEKCFLSCVHQYCINKCLRSCVKCEEKCARICQHARCDNLCFQDCSVDACVQPCKEILPCGHVCCGLCGDPCPNLCRICHRADFESGDPDTDQYVMLHDCSHVVEVDSLTKHIGECLELLQWPCCPICSSVIKRSQRYKSYLKQAKTFCTKNNDTEDAVEEMRYSLNSMYGDDNGVPARFQEIHQKISKIFYKKELGVDTVYILKVCIECLGKMVKISKKYDDLSLYDSELFDTLFLWIFRHLTSASYEQLTAVEKATGKLYAKYFSEQQS